MIRYSYSDDSVRETDVHTKGIFERELQLARDFVSERMPALGDIVADCPMSGESRKALFFRKWNQGYAYCQRTWNLSLAQLPDENTRRDYFWDSDLARFRASDEYQEAREIARKDLWAHQLDWIGGRLSRYGFNNGISLLDWGGRAQGWANLLQSLRQVKEVGTIETLAPLKEKPLTAKCQVVTVIDVLQRESNPANLFKKVFQKLEPGGLLLLTCRNGAGFDIMSMREFSRTIFPLDHICLPSPEGLSNLLTSSGFEVLELGTPGLFDVELIRRDKDLLPQDQFFQRYLFDVGDTHLFERLQGFLQQNNLSSHMRAVARKPEAR